MLGDETLRIACCDVHEEKGCPCEVGPDVGFPCFVLPQVAELLVSGGASRKVGPPGGPGLRTLGWRKNSDAKAAIFIASSKHRVGPTVVRPAGGEGCGTFSDCQTVSNRAPRELPEFSGRCAATEATTSSFCIDFGSKAGYTSRVATTKQRICEL
jgi:hypothetical protein